MTPLFFYDDVNFIKRGWINRNNILVGNQAHLFSIPLIKASQNKLIKDSFVNYETDWVTKLKETIKSNYKKAPNFESTFNLLCRILDTKSKTISNLSILSITEICSYLKINTEFKLSSQLHPNTKGLDKAERLISISHLEEATEYINPSGGIDLYDKEYFKKNNLKLSFIKNS